MNKKSNKKIILIILITLISLVFIGISYAVISKIYEMNYKVKTGNLIIEDVNLLIENRLTGEMEDTLRQWSPGDASLITWEIKNKGVAAIDTRHTLEIYWNNPNIANESKKLLALYPANMTNDEVLKDYAGQKEKVLDIDYDKKIVVDEQEKVGISYTFYGDTLDGTDKKGYAKEVDYDENDYGTNLYTTVENETMMDKIAFRLLLSPDISYLYQEEKLSVRLITEVLQYTENGTQEWNIESVETLN